LKHIVVLMMENRSFDHMLGGLRAVDPRINGLVGKETNLDSTGELVRVQPLAEFQGQLDLDPDTHFPAVHKQLYYGTDGPPGPPSMNGFVQSYFGQMKDADHSRKIMYYFSPEKLPVLASLASNFAVFNGWFSSVPGPSACNHAFAHYGTAFGQVGMDVFYYSKKYISIYERLVNAGHSAKLYHFDTASSSRDAVDLLQNQPALVGTYNQFLEDCRSGTLPQYSFVEPNYTHHSGDDGAEVVASDQHPDHDVHQGEVFIATVYNAIRQNPSLWQSTALLIVYSEHGGIYDHVPPPSCPPDGFQATPDQTGVPGLTFLFDRLGVRVPAILVSPWIAKGTVVAGPEDPVNGKVFDHASIPATATSFFIGEYPNRTPREIAAQTFLDLLTDEMRPDSDCLVFGVDGGRGKDGAEVISTPRPGVPRILVDVAAKESELYQAGYQSDQPEGRDLLDVTGEVDALAAVLAAKEVGPPLSLGLFGDWGSGKSFFMRQLESRISVLQEDAQAAHGDSAFCENIVQIGFNAWNYIDTNLWASLTSEIFEGLAAALARRRGEDSQEERARVLAAASSSLTILAEAERKKAEADELLRRAEERLTALQGNRAAVEVRLEPFELFKAAYRFAISQPDVQGYIKSAARELHVDQVETAASEVKSEILELHGILSTLLFAMRNTERLWIWIVAPVAALTLGWISSYMLRRFSLGGLMAQTTTLLVAIAGFLGWFMPGARKALGFIQKARDAHRQLIEKKQNEYKGKLNMERTDLISKVEEAQRDVDAAARQATAVSAQLEQLRADRRLANYIRQRNESTDYTKHLGLIARVRMDFKQLSTLLRDVREEADSEMKRRQQEEDHEQRLFPRIDRIILYIDDLDRCPAKNVVEVLQAVNLLLAFPLFVVVVGVDPRWLLHSLEQHSIAMSAGRDEAQDAETQMVWESTPLNYLEKIFQIPYTLRPMDSFGFSNLVDALSAAPDKPGPMDAGSPTSTVKRSPGAATSTAAESKEVSEAKVSAPELSRKVERRPDHLRIEDREQSFMKLLHELIPSPRAGKRFINIYRLLRASVRQRERVLGGHPKPANDGHLKTGQ
jgi:phospholipase C